MKREQNDEHEQDYKSARMAAIGADRMSCGLPCIPDKKRGDLTQYVRLGILAIRLWKDLTALKASVHPDYCKCLQMTEYERAEAAALAGLEKSIASILSRDDARIFEPEIENEIGERVMRP